MKALLFCFVSMIAFAQAPAHSVTLTWAAPATGGTVTGFNIKRSTTAGTEVTIGTTTMPTVTFVDPFSITDEGKTFFYVVTSTGPGGESGPSNEASATIPFSVPGVPSGLAVQAK